MNGDTASLYNLSDCQEPVQIATVKREGLNSRKRGSAKKTKKKENKAQKTNLHKTREVKLTDAQQF